MIVVNDNLSTMAEQKKQEMEASFVANQIASAINSVSSYGNGSQISFFNRVSDNIVNISIFSNSSVRVYYLQGGFESAPIVTNKINFTSVPLNKWLIFKNQNEVVLLESTN
jgi:hypothetical protein